MVEDRNALNPMTLRRLRQNEHVRSLTRQHRVSPDQMIQPLFVIEGLDQRQEVPGLTGTYRETTETLLRQVESDIEAGVRKFLLFTVPEEKRTHAFDPAFASKQVEAIKSRFGKDIFLSVDVCLCSSTVHGQ